MFTGIITDIGTVRKAEQRGDLRLTIGCAYDMDTVDLGASIACSGACLTVVDKGEDWFAVDVSAETVDRTAPDMWIEGSRLNLERALRVGDELGGHIVTGHVDTIASVVGVDQEGASTRVVLEVSPRIAGYIAPKGSVALDGVSLTVNDVYDENAETSQFWVNLIPHTANHTTFGGIAVGRKINLEIDVLARYLKRMTDAR
jgi:riboflavin synthase